jgi:hypothetical protein
MSDAATNFESCCGTFGWRNAEASGSEVFFIP